MRWTSTLVFVSGVFVSCSVAYVTLFRISYTRDEMKRFAKMRAVQKENGPNFKIHTTTTGATAATPSPPTPTAAATFGVMVKCFAGGGTTSLPMRSTSRTPSLSATLTLNTPRLTMNRCSNSLTQRRSNSMASGKVISGRW